jgi:phosphoribosylaminoimidazolecarboxamide formyltransferase/IMP cyclohydrolase
MVRSYPDFASLNGETTRFNLAGNALQTLRYGENPHQSATWYGSGTMAQGWGKATLLQGKELSYNNLVDLEAARRLIAEFGRERTGCRYLETH